MSCHLHPVNAKHIKTSPQSGFLATSMTHNHGLHTYWKAPGQASLCSTHETLIPQPIEAIRESTGNYIIIETTLYTNYNKPLSLGDILIGLSGSHSPVADCFAAPRMDFQLRMGFAQRCPLARFELEESDSVGATP